jgi:hypothetical protein
MHEQMRLCWLLLTLTKLVMGTQSKSEPRAALNFVGS